MIRAVPEAAGELTVLIRRRDEPAALGDFCSSGLQLSSGGLS